MDVRENLSLIIGKNNSGKTSLLFALNKFINHNDRNRLSYDDFSIDAKCKLTQLIELDSESYEDGSIELDDVTISLKVYINYDEDSSLANIGAHILNLDVDDHTFVLEYLFYLPLDQSKLLKRDFAKFKIDNPDRSLDYFANRYVSMYFKHEIRVLESCNEDNYKEIPKSEADKIICLEIISAKRDVDNDDYNRSNNPKTLSKLSTEYYRANKALKRIDLSQLDTALQQADTALTNSYETIFKEVMTSIDEFCKEGVTAPQFSVISSIKEDKLLADNTTVTYNYGGHALPEDYNGLGYLNLITIIYNIHLKIDYMKLRGVDKMPADVNILYIEEPEAHTHPQMQYIFIRNIKKMLSLRSKGIGLQTIISTHSAHIVSQSEFDDIKYFLKDTNNKNVIVKNLSDLERSYVSSTEEDEIKSQKQQFDFLKKYLKLENSELFFAEKAIFIEGDTERILLPSMMFKIDSLKSKEDNLLSQNISIVSVGAYSHIFEKFIRFLGIKVLIITDIDSAKEDRNKCMVSEGIITTNKSICYFMGESDLSKLLAIKQQDRVLKYDNNKWVKASDDSGLLYLAYQTNESGVVGRSFEEAFIALNYDFIKSNAENFNLVNKVEFEQATPNYYTIAEKCIDKKTSFATNILYYSNIDMSNWEVPAYIKNGLLWLMK